MSLTIWWWTHQASHFHHWGPSTRPPRVKKAQPSGSIREPSRLRRSPPPHMSVRKLHRHAVWSGPAMLWAGVSTNVLIRWGRKLQVWFCQGKNVEKLTGRSTLNCLHGSCKLGKVYHVLLVWYLERHTQRHITSTWTTRSTVAVVFYVMWMEGEDKHIQ